MRKLLLSLVALLAFASLAQAQTSCGGVNFTPAPGVTCLLEPTAPTYGATSLGLIPGASATDVACISGVAGKVIRLQAVRISGTGTAVTTQVLLTKHVSLDTGGTLALTTAIPVPYALDSTNPAAVAVTQAWTAPPTINDAAPGIIDSGVLGLAATSATGNVPYLVFDYAERNFSQAPLLRTAAQQICVNLNTTSTTSVLNISFKWTELAQ